MSRCFAGPEVEPSFLQDCNRSPRRSLRSALMHQRRSFRQIKRCIASASNPVDAHGVSTHHHSHQSIRNGSYLGVCSPEGAATGCRSRHITFRVRIGLQEFLGSRLATRVFDNIGSRSHGRCPIWDDHLCRRCSIETGR